MYNEGLSRAQVEGLTSVQIAGIEVGLTREQVSFPWFDHGHVEAAAAGKPYADYQGLTSRQASRVAEGMSRSQAAGVSASAAFLLFPPERSHQVVTLESSATEVNSHHQGMSSASAARRSTWGLG
jgi:hypothetical protein